MVYKLVKNNKSILATDKYCYEYKAGTIMEDKLGIGFFCYKTINDMKKFIIFNFYGKEFFSFEFIKVKLLSNIESVREICAFPGSLWLYYQSGIAKSTYIPEGTIICKKIKVLSEPKNILT